MGGKDVFVGVKMRNIFDTQQGLEFQPWDPRAGAELEKMDEILKENQEILKRVGEDISAGVDTRKGRPGMSAEQVLRVAIVKQLYSWDYRLLYERIEDSRRLRKFCRYEWQAVHKFQTLQDNVKKLSPETLEAMNRVIVMHAVGEKIEKGGDARVDTTVVESNIHHPTDSTLIYDAVRVITRLLQRARGEFPEAGICFHDRTRVVKKRMKAVIDARSREERKRLYRDLVKYGEEVLGYAKDGAKALQSVSGTLDSEMLAKVVAEDLMKYAHLLERILDQTRRRVFDGEDVPSQEKVVSIFEEHTDIIVKKRRETEFGHKVCFNVGKSGMVLDCMIERGNPADTTLYPKTLDRHVDLFGGPPHSFAADGGFASSGNATYAREIGVSNVFFNKRTGRILGDLIPSRWVEKKLRKFRAGIEGVISALKRGVGLGRCVWRGWKSFKSYVWASILAHNLKMMARVLLKREEAAMAGG